MKLKEEGEWADLGGKRKLLLGRPNETSHKCANPYCLPFLVNPKGNCASMACVELIVPREISGSGVLAPPNKIVSFLRADRSHALSYFIYFHSTYHRALPMVVAHWHLEVDQEAGCGTGGGRQWSGLMEAFMGAPEEAMVYTGNQTVLGNWPSRRKWWFCSYWKDNSLNWWEILPTSLNLEVMSILVNEPH